MYEIVLSILGLLLGYVLARIAPEEVNWVRRGNIILSNSLYVIILGLFSFLLIKLDLRYLLFTLIGLVVLFLQIKIKKIYLYLIGWLLMFGMLFVIPNYISISVSLVFLLGFPLGIMLCQNRT